MIIGEIVERIQKFLPFETGLDNDRIGIQLQSRNVEIKRLLVAYEITPEVIEEAKGKKSNCIVSFHPLIYNPVEAIFETERVGNLLSQLIRNDISLIVCHTNFDAYEYGTSWLFANAIGLEYIDFLDPNPQFEKFGMGVYGKFKKQISVEEFLTIVQNTTQSPLRWCKGRFDYVQSVGILAGSGISYSEKAFEKGVDAFITADVSYHYFHKYDGKLMIVDPGHWEMEYFVPFGLSKLFMQIFDSAEIEIVASSVYTNPINYWSQEDFNRKQKVLINNMWE